MVRGRDIAVTAVTFTYQCAEMTTIPRGRGMLAPKSAQALEKRFRSSAFIGLPCPRNTAGIVLPAMCVASCVGLIAPTAAPHLTQAGRRAVPSPVDVAPAWYASTQWC